MKKDEFIPKPKSKFLKVRCSECKNEQKIFSRPTKDIKCLECGDILAKTTGGNFELKARLLEVLG